MTEVTQLQVRVPAAVAEELEREGMVDGYPEVLGKSVGDDLGMMLQVYEVSQTVVDLVRLPGRVVALRDAFAKWIQSAPEFRSL